MKDTVRSNDSDAKQKTSNEIETQLKRRKGKKRKTSRSQSATLVQLLGAGDAAHVKDELGDAHAVLIVLLSRTVARAVDELALVVGAVLVV